MGIDRRQQIYPHSNWKLTTMQNKWPISPWGGHDDGRYEHTFVDIVSCDDFHFNDTLTQSFDNQPHTIAQYYWLIEITQQKDWHTHFEFQFMICDTAKLLNPPDTMNPLKLLQQHLHLLLLESKKLRSGTCAILQITILKLHCWLNQRQYFWGLECYIA
jgi:hypothetical protein